MNKLRWVMWFSYMSLWALMLSYMVVFRDTVTWLQLIWIVGIALSGIFGGAYETASKHTERLELEKPKGQWEQ